MPPGEGGVELSGHVLLQSLNEDFPFPEDSDPSCLERLASGCSVREEEMGDAAALHHPSLAAFDAHSGATQGLSHLGQSTRSVVQRDG